MENTQLSEALDQVLEAYKRYYTIDRDTPTAPFDAEAVFDMHGEQYFLIKSAKITDIDSRESSIPRDGQSHKEKEALSKLRLGTERVEQLPRDCYWAFGWEYRL